MRNIVDDLFPDKSNGKALIEQMVDKGRRMFLLTKFLPYTPEFELYWLYKTANERFL